MLLYLSLALCVVFLAVPIYVAYAYRISEIRHIFMALARMVLRLGVLGVVAYYLVLWDNWLLNIVFLLLMVAYSAMSAVVKSRLGLREYIVPVAVGILASVVFVTGGMAILCIAPEIKLSSRYIVPVVAMMSGGIIEVQVKALRLFYGGIRHHNHLYYYLIGNGATHSEAMYYLVRRSLHAVLVKEKSRMAGMAVGIVPFVMLAMVMCGFDVLQAAAMQAVLVAAMMSASVIAAWVTLVAARRFVLDVYGRIKNIKPDVVNRTENKESTEQ